MIEIQHYSSPFGELIIGSFEDALVLCDWKYRKMRETVDKRIQHQLDSGYHFTSSTIIEKTIQQLEEYFEEKREEFDLPIRLIGTEFQHSVWKNLQNIPFGTTETYLGLSKKMGNEKAIRAVASANGANAISIIIPCHRIIGSDNSLIGYAGGLETKKKLLQLEKCETFSKQLNLF